MSDISSSKKRNPPWTRDELILALELYFRYDDRPLPSKTHPEVFALSSMLKAMSASLGFERSSTFRNKNGVAMKLINLSRWDPKRNQKGNAGLSRGSKEEGFVWSTFTHDRVKLSDTADAIRQMVTDPDELKTNKIDEDTWVTEAPEGKVLTRAHRYRERSRAIVESKKKQVLRKLKHLECEACSFSFEHSYGAAGQGIIDVHHTKPVHTLKPGAVTRLEDLALVCSNCHRIIHSQKPWLSIEEVKRLHAENFRKMPTSPSLTHVLAIP